MRVRVPLGDPMKRIAFDTETALIRPGRQAPELACLSFATDEGAAGLIHWQDPDLEEFVCAMLSGEFGLIIGHNLSFDMSVLMAHFPHFGPLIFDAYNRDGATCTMLRQQLCDIAMGTMRGFRGHDGSWSKHRYNLGYVAQRHRCAVVPNKEDPYRMQYGQLRELPLEAWPYGAKTYPIDDAIATLQVFDAQGHDVVPDEFERARSFFALRLESAWGLKTSPEGVAGLRKSTTEAMTELAAEIVNSGVPLVRADGSRNMKLAKSHILQAWSRLAEEDGVDAGCTCDTFVGSLGDGDEPICFTCKKPNLLVRRTDGGVAQLDDDACRACEDPVLNKYADYNQHMYVMAKDMKVLEAARDLPVHTNFGMVDTTRTNSTNPQVQNVRRLEGIRECFMPREGWCYWDGDYPQLELFTLSEVCYEWFGMSDLGEALKSGKDPHAIVASQILQCSYDETKRRLKLDKHDPVYKEAYNARQGGKVVNFGKPLGLGNETLIEYAWKTYHVKIQSIEKAKEISDIWFSTWREMRTYMKHIKRQQTEENGFAVVMPHSGILRSGMTFTSACSFPSQGLGAVCALRGLWRITEDCYNNPESPAYGARPVNFIHDQNLVELPFRAWGPDRTHQASARLSQLMADGANEYLHHLKIYVEPTLCDRWSKNAEPVYDEKGRLTVWTPKR